MHLVEGCETPHQRICGDCARRLAAEPWRELAACLGMDPQIFFDIDGEAEKVCAACPVRLNCLAYAVVTRTEFGIWGGVRASRLWGRTALKALAGLPRQPAAGASR